LSREIAVVKCRFSPAETHVRETIEFELQWSMKLMTPMARSAVAKDMGHDATV
jgi:hypothetical protein